ncbi:hypothetical protein AJ88_21900 [Mesorhizobium amorphae CCBAU 01583]|nr:hypothetical protein AJ88_21900 [Mesorhizobium amorphae CCBAU 01583]
MDMIEEKFDAIVIGAGMSGNAAAYTMASHGLKVLQLERGEYPGSKNVQGAIMYANMLEEIIPDFRDDAPLERHLVEQRLWVMDDTSHTGIHYRSDDFNEAKPNRYTIIRAQFDKWFSRKAREAGATVLCETTVTELVRDAKDRVVGVRTDRAGERSSRTWSCSQKACPDCLARGPACARFRSREPWRLPSRKCISCPKRSLSSGSASRAMKVA